MPPVVDARIGHDADEQVHGDQEKHVSQARLYIRIDAAMLIQMNGFRRKDGEDRPGRANRRRQEVAQRQAQQRSGQSAQEIDQQEARATKDRLYLAADDEERVHIKEDMADAAVQEHRAQHAVKLPAENDEWREQSALDKQLLFHLRHGESHQENGQIDGNQQISQDGLVLARATEATAFLLSRGGDCDPLRNFWSLV